MNKQMSKTNVENRKLWKNPDTVGKKKLCYVRNDLEKQRETSDPLSLKEIFVGTRIRKADRSYKDTDEDTTRKIAEMENVEMQQSEDGNESINAFVSVMGLEYSGRLRLYGRGVTKTTLKGQVGNFEPSSTATNDLVQKMEERIRLMKENPEEQTEQFEEQKTTMRQEIAEDLMTKIQHSKLPIDANILAILVEAFSARAPATQPIHRPSSGSNNQGRRPSFSLHFASASSTASTFSFFAGTAVTGIFFLVFVSLKKKALLLLGKKGSIYFSLKNGAEIG